MYRNCIKLITLLKGEIWFYFPEPVIIARKPHTLSSVYIAVTVSPKGIIYVMDDLGDDYAVDEDKLADMLVLQTIYNYLKTLVGKKEVVS